MSGRSSNHGSGSPALAKSCGQLCSVGPESLAGNSQGPRKMTVGNLQRDGGFSVKVDSDDADVHVTLH